MQRPWKSRHSNISTAERSRPRGLLSRSACPTGPLVIAEADGSSAEAARLRDEVSSILRDGALSITAPSSPADIACLVALARRGDVRGNRALRCEGERHRRPARPHRRGDGGDACDLPPPRSPHLQLGPCRRRESALDVSALPGFCRRAGQSGARLGRARGRASLRDQARLRSKRRLLNPGRSWREYSEL